MRSSLGYLLLAISLSGLGITSLSRADSELGETIDVGGEHYQLRIVEEILSARSLTRVSTPEGKRIERIEIIPLEVVQSLDPWPDTLNVLHATTRSGIVARELLFSPGDLWNDAHIQESARNLRRYLFVAMAEIVAVQGSTPESVVALVVTKDLWSLRLESDFSYVGSKLESLELQLVESNLGGSNRRGGAGFRLDLAVVAPNQRFEEPRLFGTRVAVNENAELSINRSTGKIEGGAGQLTIGQPLFSLATPWAWSSALGFRGDYFRRFRGGSLAELSMRSTGESVPYLTRRRILDGSIQATRSLGVRIKQDLSFGWRARVQEFRLGDVEKPLLTESIAEFSARELPRNESAGMVFLSYRSFLAEFTQLRDIETYALTEDYRLGPDLRLDVRWANPVFGFDSSYLQSTVSLAHAHASGEHLLWTRISGSLRYQPEVQAPSDWINRSAEFGAHYVSPRIGPVRIHAAGRVSRRWLDLNQTRVSLGGDSELRGFPSGYLIGSQEWGANLEARSPPLSVLTSHLGFVGFLDLGDAYERPEDIRLHASVGLGARLVLPQFNREVLRADLGFPLEPIDGSRSALLVIQWSQAFE